MVLKWRQAGKNEQRLIRGDWEAAAVEARKLIIYAGATNVVIHEEEA